MVPVGKGGPHLSRLPDTRQKDPLSRFGGPGWETGTKDFSQPGQKTCSVVVVTGTSGLCFNLGVLIIPLLLKRSPPPTL